MKKNVLVIGKNMSLKEMLSRAKMNNPDVDLFFDLTPFCNDSNYTIIYRLDAYGKAFDSSEENQRIWFYTNDEEIAEKWNLYNQLKIGTVIRLQEKDNEKISITSIQ